MTRKRLVVIFPPLSVPTSPPLGMAMLKGYIEQEMPDWEVIPLDLNLWAFDFLLDGLRQKRFDLSPAALERMGTGVAGLLEAAEVFRGDHGDAFFEMGASYDARARAILEFTQMMSEELARQADAWAPDNTGSEILSAMLAQILHEKPDAVGVSAIFSDQLPVGAMLGKALRQLHGLPVIFGGSCFTEGVQQFLTYYPDAADVVVKGDGEATLKALLEQGFDPEGIAGAHYRTEDGIEGLPSFYQKNIDAFGVPDFSGYDLKAYYAPEPVVPLLLTRGCYWRKCTFCVHYFSAGDSYRVGSMDQVVAKLKALGELGVRNFYFVDEMLAPGYFIKLADAIEDAELDISYYALSKPNASFTPKVLQAMARSGCRYIMWGLESGNQRVVDLMGKGTVVSEIPSILDNAVAAGINNHLYMIAGFPTETREEFGDSIRFLSDNASNIQVVHRSLFSLEVGSPIHSEPERYGITDIWTMRETSLGPRLGYKTASGMTMQEARAAFREALPFLKSFNSYATYLGNFRDHALLVYERHATENTHKAAASAMDDMAGSSVPVEQA